MKIQGQADDKLFDVIRGDGTTPDLLSNVTRGWTSGNWRENSQIIMLSEITLKERIKI